MSRQPHRLALKALSGPSSLRARLPHPSRSVARLPLPIHRYASTRITSAQPPMPPDMPRENYAEPTLYTLSYLSRIIKLLLYSALGISAAGLMGFESLHLYIEHRLMATPSGSSTGSDEYEWETENTSWTGRERGGTDPKLGWKARHALRGAWICQEWGAGGPQGTIGRSIHPGPRSGVSGSGAEVNRVDRGFELAEEYIDVAIREAEKRGMVFPGQEGGRPVDRTAVDLLLLKAGVLERLATEQSLLQAKRVYQEVLASTGENEVVRGVKLSGKIGDLAQRTGDDGTPWWTSGLQRAGIDTSSAQAIQEVIQEKVEKRGWFGKSSKSTSSSPINPTTTAPAIQLSPALLRAVIGILISTEANLATSAQYAQSASIQNFALSLLPPPSPNSSSPSSDLQNLWTSHRTALLTLHSASVAHARKLPSDAIEHSTTSANLVEAIIPRVPSPVISSPLHPSAKLLERDAQALAGEANYTRGVLLEKTKEVRNLEVAGECFEKAMGHAGERGAEWDRYWRAFARVREKLEKQREAERGLVA